MRGEITTFAENEQLTPINLLGLSIIAGVVCLSMTNRSVENNYYKRRSKSPQKSVNSPDKSNLTPLKLGDLFAGESSDSRGHHYHTPNSKHSSSSMFRQKSSPKEIPRSSPFRQISLKPRSPISPGRNKNNPNHLEIMNKEEQKKFNSCGCTIN